MDQIKLSELPADKVREELETIDFGLTVAFDAQEIDDQLSRIKIASQLQQNFTYENLVDQMNYYGLKFTADQADDVWYIMSGVGEKLGILDIKR